MNISRFSIRNACFALSAIVGAALVGDPATAAAQSSPPTADDVLGFSRYLPEDVDGYVSLVQMGRAVRTVGESKAWSRLQTQPEIKQALDQWTALQASGKVPPPLLMALDLLRSAGETEVTVAARPDLSKNLLALARLTVCGAGGFAPSRLDPADPQAAELARKQAELRQEFVKTITTIRIPSIVVAARVRESAKYEPFVRLAVEQGRATMFDELKKKAPPEVVARLEAAFAPAKVGTASLWRFQLRLGDLVPAAAIAGDLRRLPLDEAQQAAIAAAAANLSIDAHLGFVGEYLTFVLSSDDDFIRQIVDRHEGRTTTSLAASPAFAPIRAEVSADTIGILYADSTESLTETRDAFLPLLRSTASPEFLALVGAPLQFSAAAGRFTAQLEAAFAATPKSQFAVVHLDRGLRHLARQEFDREPAAAAAGPLVTIAAVPATATGYVAWRSRSLDGLWDQVSLVLEQGEAQIGRMAKRFGDDPDFAARLEQVRGKYRAVMLPISEKLAPSTRGEMAIVIGPFVKFAAEGEAGKEVPEVSIPSAALLILSPSPDQAIEGFHELYQALVDLETPLPGAPVREVPVTFDARNVDGIEARVLAFPKAPLVGIEPHVAKLGQGLVISSSLELTRQIRETASGRAPAIGATPAHQAVANELPATAEQQTYIDGAALVRSFRGTSEQIFAFVEVNAGKLRMSDRDQQEFALVRRLVGAAFEFASTFRGAHSSLVAEGRANVLKERIRIEDTTE